jgi:hypothetical protein
MSHEWLTFHFLVSLGVATVTAMVLLITEVGNSVGTAGKHFSDVKISTRR